MTRKQGINLQIRFFSNEECPTLEPCPTVGPCPGGKFKLFSRGVTSRIFALCKEKMSAAGILKNTHLDRISKRVFAIRVGQNIDCHKDNWTEVLTD